MAQLQPWTRISELWLGAKGGVARCSSPVGLCELCPKQIEIVYNSGSLRIAASGRPVAIGGRIHLTPPNL